MASIVEQELAVRLAFPTAIPPITGVSPHAMPAAGSVFVKDSATSQLTCTTRPGNFITTHYRWNEDGSGNLVIEYSADGSTGWTTAATVVEL